MKGIITLCGSTKYPETFSHANSELTKADWIVLSVGTFMRKEFHGETNNDSIKLKTQLDKLHKEKIAISQAIVVLNKENYIGTSTKSELEYARKLNKEIYWYIFNYGYSTSNTDNRSSNFIEPRTDKDWVKLLV